jgi:hypothetical protein
MEEVAKEKEVKPVEPQKSNYVKLPKWLVVVLVLVVLIVLAAGLFYLGMMLGKGQNPGAATQPTPTTALTPTGAVTPTKGVPEFPQSSNPNLKRFISEKLGISFTYLISQNGQTIAAQEIGNKVYVYFTNAQATQGQYVEIFDKDKNQTLEQAIKAQILKGYSESDCPIKPQTQYVPAGFTALSITLPISQSDEPDAIQAKAAKCPSKYTAFGGMAYFMEDPSHPDKMLFLSIGQYLISTEGDNKGWQNTIQLF